MPHSWASLSLATASSYLLLQDAIAQAVLNDGELHRSARMLLAATGSHAVLMLGATGLPERRDASAVRLSAICGGALSTPCCPLWPRYIGRIRLGNSLFRLATAAAAAAYACLKVNICAYRPDRYSKTETRYIEQLEQITAYPAAGRMMTTATSVSAPMSLQIIIRN